MCMRQISTARPPPFQANRLTYSPAFILVRALAKSNEGCSVFSRIENNGEHRRLGRGATAEAVATASALSR